MNLMIHDEHVMMKLAQRHQHSNNTHHPHIQEGVLTNGDQNYTFHSWQCGEERNFGFGETYQDVDRSHTKLVQSCCFQCSCLLRYVL